MTPLRVLLTNLKLDAATGTECYTYDVARRLLWLGHSPMVYSPRLGPLATQLVELGIPVVDRIERIAAVPDVIHGHHALETMTAMLRFPETPAVFVCHDAAAWHDRPPRFPRLRHWVAVDDACRERLVGAEGVAPEQVTVVQNGVDLRRFRPRSTPLPERPHEALLMSNYADHATAKAVRAACEQCDMHLTCVGKNFREQWTAPEAHLEKFDLVFAKARCAREALAVGNAVIVCDAAGSGPLVTAGDLERLAGCNFGRRLLRGPLDPAWLVAEIRRYDAADAAEASRRLRALADLDIVAGQLVELYHSAIDAQRQSLDDPFVERIREENRAAAEFVQWWSVHCEEAIRRERRRRRPLAQLALWWQSLRSWFTRSASAASQSAGAAAQSSSAESNAVGMPPQTSSTVPTSRRAA